MGRRVITYALAWMLAAMVLNPCWITAAEPVRLALDEGPVPVEFTADQISAWQDSRQRYLVFNGRFSVKTGALHLQADRAFVWIELGNDKSVNRGEIYAEGNLNGIQQLKPGDTALLAFSTPGEVRVRGKIDERSQANSPFAKQAAEAREPRRLPPIDPPSTDGSIQPVQAVGPPMLDPIPGVASPPPSGSGVPVAPTPPPAPRPRTPGGSTIEPPTFETPTVPLPNVNTRRLKLGNRSANPMNAKYLNLANGEQVALITGGVKLLATFEDASQLILDIETDQMVIWQSKGKASDLVDAMTDRDGVQQGNEKETEIYLSGNVVMRYGSRISPRNADGTNIEEKTLRAERVYYDVANNKAIALKADLELIRPGLSVPAHFTGEEMRLLSPHEFQVLRSEGFASKLPADPGLDLRMRELTLTEEPNQVRRTIFGYPFVDRFTGEDVVGPYRHFRARNTFIDLADVPIFWLPYFAGDADDPVGPLQNINFRQDKVFGTQFLTTWSVLELIGVKKLPGERFNLMLDYLSQRGPAAGLSYDLAGNRLFGYDAPFTTRVLAYGINDHGNDILGGTRSEAWDPPGFRGRAMWRHVQTYDNFTYQGQVGYLSDRNFLEQYYNYEFNQGPNQETFSYLKYQEGNFAASLLGNTTMNQYWVTETEWLPRGDVYLLGQSFWDRLTYNTWASAGYANFQAFTLPFSEYPKSINPFTVPVEYPINTTRLDWMQQLSAPFSAGAFKVMPYANLDLAYYSNDVNGDSRGRVYAGGGARVSMPLSKQYDEIESDLFNLRGIFHKATFSANYYNAWSDTPYSLLTQLDRLNDDATQQSLRDIDPWQQIYNPGPVGNMLFNSPLYNPRLYAIRRLVDTRPDTLDSIQVLQGELRQRWQTKRGYPGMEHTVDYVTLDLSASYFPEKNRDNFGHPVSFLEYAATWAVGDRNGLTSNGWVDPFAFGTRYWNVTGYFNRPDGTNISVSYRHFDPVGSRQLSGAISYLFSPKYGITFASSYDFGIQSETTSLIFNRIGTDLTWSVGFSYNSIVNNFSFNFMVFPNLMGTRSTTGGNFLGQQNAMAGRN